jgi:hypothetical protein
MVQEVQKGVWVYNETTLETIEAVGTSSRKIIEWRQTRWEHYVISCEWTWWAANWTYNSWDPRQSPKVNWPITLSSMEGKQEFTVTSWSVRVPTGWTYRITVERWWGVSGSYSTTFYIIKWTQSTDEVLFHQTSGNRVKITTTITVDLGKFDTISLWNDYYYEWNAPSYPMWDTSTISIQQL